MPNGRNAGRLFADCFNIHGHGESHRAPDHDYKPGDECECASCGAKLLLNEDWHVERLTSRLSHKDDYIEADLVRPLP